LFEQAYSSDGLTNDLYACSLTEVEPMLRLRRRKPRVLLALPQMLLMVEVGHYLVEVEEVEGFGWGHKY
jgi:hypothetical protein